MKYSNYEIIIVDDGSTDGSLENLQKIAKLHPKLKVIKTLNRKGIPGSRNLGIEYSSGKYVAFLDIDMQIGDGWPNLIVEKLNTHPEIGGIVPKVLDIQNKKIIQAAGIKIIPHTGWVIGRGYGEIDHNQYNHEIITAIGAAGSIVRRNVLDQLAGFDETLGMFDDIDMGWRIKLLGWQTLYLPTATMYHWTSKPWSKRPKSSSMINQEFYIDTLIRALLKNLELKNLYRYLPQYITILVIRVTINLIRGNTIPLKGSILSLVWNIVNINSTIQARIHIQSQRKKTDQELFNDDTFANGSFISLYLNSLHPALDRAKNWNK